MDKASKISLNPGTSVSPPITLQVEVTEDSLPRFHSLLPLCQQHLLLT